MNSQPGQELPLAVVGCDFRVAPSAVRSRLVPDAGARRELFEQLSRNAAVDGLVDLNTCNRNEWIVSGPQPNWAAELMRAAMLGRAGEACRGWLRPYLYVGQAAARHVFRVAVGQESLVTGERQISGQLYRAIETARRLGTSSRTLNGLGSIAGRLVRIGMRRGCVHNSAVGVHSLAVSYLMNRLEFSPQSRLAVVGLGRIGRRVVGALREGLGLRPVLCNRTAAGAGDAVRPLGDLDRVLAEADAAVICTGALSPVVRPEHLPQRPLLLVDIGIPQQVEREGLPAQAEVVGLDQLADFYHRQRCKEGQSAPLADTLVERALDEFAAFCQEAGFSTVLRTMQRHQRQLLDEEIARLLDDRFGELAPQLRARLAAEMRGLLLDYSGEIMRAIHETLGESVPGGRENEPPGGKERPRG